MFEVDVASRATATLMNVDGFEMLKLDGKSGAENLVVSGTFLALSGAAAPQELRFMETTPNGTNYVALEAPDSVGSNFTISLPDTIGTAGQVLKIASVGSSDAQLEFGAATGDLDRFGYRITATVAAGDVNFGSSKTSP